MFWFWASQGSCRSWNGINSSSSYSPSLGSWIPTDPVTSPWWVLQRQAKNAQNGYLAWLPFRNWQELGSSRASHGSTNTSWITNGWPVQSTFRDVRTVLQRKEEDQDHQQNRQTYVRRGGKQRTLGNVEQSSGYNESLSFSWVLLYGESWCTQKKPRALLHGNMLACINVSFSLFGGFFAWNSIDILYIAYALNSLSNLWLGMLLRPMEQQRSMQYSDPSMLRTYGWLMLWLWRLLVVCSNSLDPTIGLHGSVHKNCTVSSPCIPNYISCMRFGQSFNFKFPKVIGYLIQFAKRARSTRTLSAGVPFWRSLYLLGLMHLGVFKGILHRSKGYGVTEKMWVEDWKGKTWEEKKYIEIHIMTRIQKHVYLQEICIYI